MLKHQFCLLVLFLLTVESKTVKENSSRLLTDIAETVATQSSTYSEYNRSWSAEKVLDGCYVTNCIARTYTHMHNWIQLDLKNVYKISAIVIHAPSIESCPSCSMSHERLYVGMSRIKDHQQCVRTDIRTSRNTSNVIVIETNTGSPLPDSRYITLGQDYESLIIAEIQVFGDCLDNYCGRDCSEFCFCKTPLLGAAKINGTSCLGACLKGWEGEMCDKRKCSKQLFGYNCRHKCYCLEGCDPWTGECLGADRRCNVGWSGPSCQRQGLEPVYQTNTEFESDKNTNKCDYIPSLKTSLRINFHFPVSVSHIEMLYEPERYPQKPFQPELLLVKTGNIYKDLKQESVTTLDCNNKEKQTFLLNGTNNISGIELKNAEVKFCEIRFYTCSFGTFGIDCFYQCHCANKRPCNSVDGTCPVDGMCEPRWAGKACDKECAFDTFGEECRNKCHCHNNDPCHYHTGECPNGCSPGWSGVACNKPDLRTSEVYTVVTTGINTVTAIQPDQNFTTKIQVTRNIPIIAGSAGALAILFGFIIFCVVRVKRKMGSNTVPNGTIDETEASEPPYHIYDVVRKDTESVYENFSSHAEAYQSLTEGAIKIKLQQFPEIYRKMLSVRKDGKSALYYAFQVTKTDIHIKHVSDIGNKRNLFSKISILSDVRKRLLVAWNQIADFSMMSLSDDTQANVIEEFNSTSQYLDELLNTDNPYFEVLKHNALPGEPKTHTGESSMQMLKTEELSFLISDDSNSHPSFWEAFLENGISTCIIIGQVSIKTDRRMDVGDFTIKCTSTSEKESFTELKIKARHLGSRYFQSRNILVCSKWEDFMEISIDPVSVLDLLEYLCDTIIDGEYVLIQCEHNRNKAVLLSVITATLLKMKTGVVDIISPINAAKGVFSSSLSTYEQFKFIHDVVLLAIRRHQVIEETFED